MLEPAAALTHGVQALRWTALACDPAALSVDLSVSRAGRVESLGSGLAARGVAPWDTTRLPDGLQELRAVFRDRSGAPLGTVVREVMVNNAAAWHRGRIAADETWDAGRLHIVEGAVEIAAGVRLTLPPGCIV